jgi:hypothetical protein
VPPTPSARLRSPNRRATPVGPPFPPLALDMRWVSSLSAPSAFIRVIEAFASDFCNRVDYPTALIALFSARNQANPPPCFLVTGKAERGCPGSVRHERDVSLRAVGATVFNDCVAGFQPQFAGSISDTFSEKHAGEVTCDKQLFFASEQTQGVLDSLFAPANRPA